MKTKQKAIKKQTFIAALKATSERRGSLQALQGKDGILRIIQLNPIMQQRWVRYCEANYYAKGIQFDDVIEAMADLLNSQ